MAKNLQDLIDAANEKATKKTVSKTVNKQPNDQRTKLDRAREVFVKMNGRTRGEVIDAFISEVGLTKAGASTYYYLVQKK